jgi:hypothetical protein
MDGLAPDGRPREVSAVLALGLLFAPILFVWMLLGRGYSKGIRIGAGIYAAFVVLGLASALLRHVR